MCQLFLFPALIATWWQRMGAVHVIRQEYVSTNESGEDIRKTLPVYINNTDSLVTLVYAMLLIHIITIVPIFK